MGKKYIVANWKSNKNAREVSVWFEKFQQILKTKKSTPENVEIIVCPAYVHLYKAHDLVQKYQLPIKLCSQNVSPFDFGSYTGEVCAGQLKDYVEYAMIGHSERRQYFCEDDKILLRKIEQLKSNNLKIIYCVPDANTPIPNLADIAAYEPVSAIGTGKPQQAEEAISIISAIKNKYLAKVVLYGGSVKSDNIVNYTGSSLIDGALIGKASLDVASFWEMIENATYK